MSLHYYRILCIALVGVMGFQLSVQGQSAGDRYQAVQAAELVEFPHRYWSRGIVFEDVLVDAKGRDASVGGRSFARFRTRQAGDIYVSHAAMSSGIAWREGRSYLFAGTIVSETGRGLPFMSPRTRYFITIDSVEPVVVADAEAVLSWLEADPAERPALQAVQQAVRSAQRELMARAENNNVEFNTMFDPEIPTMDDAAEAARLAVRQLEADMGFAGTELLSRLVRELLADQYQIRPEIAPARPIDEKPAPAAVAPKPEPVLPIPPEPSQEVFIEDSITEKPESVPELPEVPAEPMAEIELEAAADLWMLDFEGEWVGDSAEMPLADPEPEAAEEAVWEDWFASDLDEPVQADLMPDPETMPAIEPEAAADTWMVDLLDEILAEEPEVKVESVLVEEVVPLVAPRPELEVEQPVVEVEVQAPVPEPVPEPAPAPELPRSQVPDPIRDLINRPMSR